MESMLEEITIERIYSFFVIFSRIGSLLMALPGIGENYTPIRGRLTIAIFLTLISYNFVIEFVPKYTDNFVVTFIIILNEVIIGVFQGIIVRIFLSAAQIAGTIISTQSALGTALLFDPNQGSQGAIISNFLTILAITLFFVSYSDHLIISGVINSFAKIPPGIIIYTNDYPEALMQAVSKSFETGFKISAPIVVVSFVIIVAAGILAKLMPTMQVFFVLTPIQILVSFVIMFVSIQVIMLWFNRQIEGLIVNLF